MNVTREVVTDLLPIYFAGEASGDTKVLVEDYFRQDPDFERIARSAATPLETLRAARPIAASLEKEKRDLESVFWGLRRRTWLFGVSLFLTLAPLSFAFSNGHIVSLMVRDSPWHAAFDWSLAAVLWLLYFARPRRRTASLVSAIFFTLIPIPFVLHSVFVGGPVVEFALFWIVAAFIWSGYFRQRSC
ncbi:MAG TPA: hypothetical protein VN176_18290 [Verrucomicrobiae bacterium]|jgi:hypothetical protein|nr:hypothetical protein [Verrucomicrobiae bacterium]